MSRHRTAAVVALVAGAMVAASGTALAGTGSRLPSAAAVTHVTAKLGSARSVLPGFFGVNFDYGGASEYPKDPGLDSQLAALKPGTLRWPGGTSANFFQWKIGFPVNPPSGSTCPSSSASSAFRFTLADLLAAYKATKAPPVFDLNVMTSTRACQISMLRQAKKLGLPVKYVELGNEYYLGMQNYPHYFATAAGYGRAVAGYVKAVHKDFRGALVAAVGSLPDSTARERTWNKNMLDAARTAGGLPNAVTLHVYPSYNTALTKGALPALFTEPYTELTTIGKVIGALPVRRPVWLTEYNLRPKHTANSNPAQTSYAQALFVTEMDLLLVDHVTTAQFVNFWAAFGGDASYGYTGKTATPVLTPGGLALTLVDRAAHGATKTRPISFTGAPALKAGGSPALIGQFFSAGSSKREVLVNLSSHALSVKTGAAIPAGAPYEVVTFSGSPARQVSTASALTVKHKRTGGSLAVPAYSIIMIS
jgi:hypothetical protein